MGFIIGLRIATRRFNARQFAKSDTKVKEAFDVSKERDGSRRIQKELAESGDNYNVKTIAASMKRQDLVAKAARKFKCTTDSKHKMPVAPNLLAQDCNETAPNQKWAEDITYVRV